MPFGSLGRKEREKMNMNMKIYFPGHYFKGSKISAVGFQGCAPATLPHTSALVEALSFPLEHSLACLIWQTDSASLRKESLRLDLAPV